MNKPPKVKKIPMRMCIVTREKYPKKELIRVVNFQNEIKIDLTGKQNGRGCYLKKDIDVITKAKKNKILNRVFETEVSEDIYNELIEVVTK